jgi:hypothetical protein
MPPVEDDDSLVANIIDERRPAGSHMTHNLLSVGTKLVDLKGLVVHGIDQGDGVLAAA